MSRVGANLRLSDLTSPEVHDAPVAFWEIIAENLMARPEAIDRVASLGRPVSLHCVGMNLGGLEPLSASYLDQIAHLADRLAVVRVSDHLCWQHHGGVYHHDLLPFPRTDASTDRVAERVDAIQQRLGRRLDVENLSVYAEFAASDRTEAAVLTELVDRTGCGLLLDLCNLEVNETNHRTDADQVLDALPLDAVAEVHVAGPSWQDGWCIDTHAGLPSGRQIAWLRDRLPTVPVCYERDQQVPVLRDRLSTVGGIASSIRKGEA